MPTRRGSIEKHKSQRDGNLVCVAVRLAERSPKKASRCGFCTQGYYEGLKLKVQRIAEAQHLRSYVLESVST